MNKKALKVAFVAVLTMVSGVNVFNAQKSETLSDIALANVEALAQAVIVGMPCLEVPYSYCIYLGPGPNDYLELPGTFHE